MVFDLQPTLYGELVTLRPLQPADFDALFAAASDPRIWEQHPQRDRYKLDVFQRLFDAALDSGGAFVVLDADSGDVIGSSRYEHFDEDAREIEIGYSFLARSHWGGRYNSEMKRLMLAHAFRFVDRVLFFVGDTNVRSQKAMERIGGVRCGLNERAGEVPHIIYEIRKELQGISERS